MKSHQLQDIYTIIRLPTKLLEGYLMNLPILLPGFEYVLQVFLDNIEELPIEPLGDRQEVHCQWILTPCKLNPAGMTILVREF